MSRRGLFQGVLCAAIATLGAFPALGAGRTAAAAPPAVRPPDDPLFKYQWHLPAMQIPAAWAVSRGAGATVAVLDTGVAYADRGPYRRAPDLAGTRFAAGRDFVAGDAFPDDVPRSGDRRSHGTQIAAIIAQTAGNGIGGAGVAPEAAIMPVRVLNPDLSGSAKVIARGLRFAADQGADIANVSIAGPERSRVLEDAVDYAWAKGVTIVAAAGNDGKASVSWPAAYPKVIAVGAVGRDGKRAPYSNYGAALDLVAPSGAGSDVETGNGPADGVLAQTLKGRPGSFCFCFTASTSAAAAQVSGVAALLVGSGRATGPAAVRRALLAGAKDLRPPGPDPEHGAGMVQALDTLTAARPASAMRPTQAPSGSVSSSPAVWLPLGLAGAGLAALAAFFLLRRGHRGRAA
ncbi:MAG: S8 family serine peptidase [Actinomycetota bacterium]|nr:S8 family serine peptidase [Actinomycetota bacterium]